MPGQIHVPISVAVQGLDKALKSLGGIGKIVKGAAAAFVTLAGSAKTASVAMATVEGAKTLERNLAGLETVFKDTTPQMVEFGKAASDIGLSMAEAAKATTFIGSVLKQSGFSIEETADLTERLVGLGADLALTYGYDVQEALLGMTALFRGEYDPIEKFGVAMKQSEIDAEKLARGLGHLTGAEERLADQQIRVEFLFDRAADAMGAVERQSGNLVVQQMRLRAEFENVRDTVAENLLPTFAEFTGGLAEIVNNIAPRLKAVFDDLAPVITRVFEKLLPIIERVSEALVDFIGFIVDVADVMTDPFSPLGKRLIEINALFGATKAVISDLEYDGDSAFNLFIDMLGMIADAIFYALDGLSRITIWLANFGKSFQSIMDYMQKRFGGFDMNYFLNNLGTLIENTNNLTDADMAARDAMIEAAVGTEQFREQLRLLRADMKETVDDEVWDILAKRAAGALTGESGDGDGTGGVGEAVKDYVAEFFDGIANEVKKQQARIKLEGLGLTEGLIESILGSQGWEKVFNRVISGGVDALQKLQDEWASTKAGIDEATKAAEAFEKAQQEALKAAREEAEEFIADLQEVADKAQQAYEDADEAAKEFMKRMKDIAQLDILPNAEEQLGRFEMAVKSKMTSIRSELISAFDEGLVLERDLQSLQAWVATEEFELRRLAQLRDDLANRYSLSEALINEYRTALTGAFSLTSLLGEIKSATESRIVNEVSQGVVKFGKGLRDFQVTVTRSYEETVETVQSKTSTILTGFREMADKARLFGENLRKLKALGLDPMLFQQLVDAGVEAGGETAQALVDGGAESINEINTIFSEIDAIGAELGEEVAATLYGAGIDMSDGLLEGIRSKQEEMYELARTMAETFSEQFQAKLDIAVDKPVEQLRKTAEATADAVPDIEEVDIAGIAYLRAMIEKAGEALAKVKLDITKAGIETKIDILEDLRTDLKRGMQLDLSGIVAGLPTTELYGRAVATGAPTVINNNYTVMPGNKLEQNQTLEVLKKVTNNNGSLTVYGIKTT